MTELLFHLAGGTPFLVFSALLCGLLGTGYFLKGHAARGVFLSALLLLVAAVLTSAPPAPRGFLPLWTLMALAAATASAWRTRKGMRYSGAAAGVLAAATVLLVLLEIPYLRSPPRPAEAVASLYVAGDSLSAGIGRESVTWPELLGEALGVPVTNLASPGARLADGLRQSQAADDPQALMLVLLGGNDILLRRSRAAFEADLRALLEHLDAASRPVMMFELPVVAGYRPYGRIQRRLAREHEVPLIPARILARVFSATGGTSDGIHLTDQGHRQLADQMERLLTD